MCVYAEAKLLRGVGGERGGEIDLEGGMGAVRMSRERCGDCVGAHTSAHAHIPAHAHTHTHAYIYTHIFT